MPWGMRSGEARFIPGQGAEGKGGAVSACSGPAFSAGSFRRHDHGHLAAFHARVLLYLGDLVEIVAHAHQHVHAEFLMRQLAAAEAHGHFDLVAFLDEFEHAAHLDVVVVVVDAGAQLDLLDLDDLLLLARLVAALLLLVFVLAEIEDLADGGIGVGRYLDQVEAGFARLDESLAAGDDPEHLTSLVHETDPGAEDLFVDARAIFRGRRGKRWSGYLGSPSIVQAGIVLRAPRPPGLNP